VILSGDGFAPGSTVQGALFSTPVNLGTKPASASGSVTFDVTIPKNLEDGTHEFQLQGVDPQGRTRVLSSTITVRSRLSRTGSASNRVAPLGVALIVFGGVGVFLGRRRMLGAHYLR
jgi:hypothetical protein